MQSNGLGPDGSCICLKCGHREPHQPGVPCRGTTCPACGAVLIREGSAHHKAYLDKVSRKTGRAAG